MTYRRVVSKSHHGFTGTRVHRIWIGMIGRCFQPKHGAYERYGAKGITVCAHWLSFPAFLADMGEPPTPRHTIDRIDSNGNYEPGNCRWATYREQRLNCHRTKPLKPRRAPKGPKTYSGFGLTLTSQEWCDKLQLTHGSFRTMLWMKKGNFESAFGARMSIMEALDTARMTL